MSRLIASALAKMLLALPNVFRTIGDYGGTASQYQRTRSMQETDWIGAGAGALRIVPLGMTCSAVWLALAFDRYRIGHRVPAAYKR
jgi:hypothetical protein